MFWHKKPYSIDDLHDWQKELLKNPLTDKDAYLKGKHLNQIKKLDEHSFKYGLGFYTKYHDNEQVSFPLDKVFTDFQLIDVTNGDYLSHYFLYVNEIVFMFVNKCNRASFNVYSYDMCDGIFDFKDANDDNRNLILLDESKLYDDDGPSNYRFSIRLKEFDFINEFIGNLLDRPAKLTKNYEKYLNEVPKTSIKTLHKAFGEERYNK